MKTNKTSSASKLLARFDKDLKKIIMNDLKAIKAARAQFLNSINVELTAA